MSVFKFRVILEDDSVRTRGDAHDAVYRLMSTPVEGLGFEYCTDIDEYVGASGSLAHVFEVSVEAPDLDLAYKVLVAKLAAVAEPVPGVSFELK